MRTRRTVVIGGVAAAATAMLLAGCTSSGGGEGRTESVDKSGPVPAQGGVLVEQIIDTPAVEDRETEVPLGGTMTVTVRSIVASEGRTVVTWALRWDDPEAADDATVTLDNFIEVGPPTLVDGASLKYYYPLCDRDWRDTNNGCTYRALYSPAVAMYSPDLTNHQAIEAWAVFPEVGEGTTTVDVMLPEGLPGFSALPVSRS